MILLPVANIGKVENPSVVVILAGEDGVVHVPRMSICNRMGFILALAESFHLYHYTATHSWYPIFQSLSKVVSDTDT